MNAVEQQEPAHAIVLILAEPIDDGIRDIDHVKLEPVVRGQDGHFDRTAPRFGLQYPGTVFIIRPSEDSLVVLVLVAVHRAGDYLPHVLSTVRVNLSRDNVPWRME